VTDNTVMAFMAGRPDLLARLAGRLDASMAGCAIDGVSGDDIVQDVCVLRGDYILTGASDAHNYNIVQRLAFSRLVDIRRRGRSAGADALELMAVYDAGMNAVIDSLGGLADLLVSLPVKYKQVLLLHVVEGYGLREVGALMGLSYSAVRTVYRRAVVASRRRIDGEAVNG